jgi:hypothetical protein
VLLPKETSITFFTEVGNEVDLLERMLAYVFINEESCIKEIQIKTDCKPNNMYST